MLKTREEIVERIEHINYQFDTVLNQQQKGGDDSVSLAEFQAAMDWADEKEELTERLDAIDHFNSMVDMNASEMMAFLKTRMYN